MKTAAVHSVLLNSISAIATAGIALLWDRSRVLYWHLIRRPNTKGYFTFTIIKPITSINPIINATQKLPLDEIC